MNELAGNYLLITLFIATSLLLIALVVVFYGMSKCNAEIEQVPLSHSFSFDKIEKRRVQRGARFGFWFSAQKIV